MKHFSSLVVAVAAVSAAFILTGCETPGSSQPKSQTTPVSQYFKREDVKKMAVIVPIGGRAQGFETVIETAFLDVLINRGYDLVTRQSLEHVAKELVRTRDEAFDASTAAEIGKLANASHIVVVRMPLLQEKHNRQTGAVTHDIRITAQVIEVQNGRIVMVAQGGTDIWANMITFNGGSDAASAAEKVAKKVAQKLPQ